MTAYEYLENNIKIFSFSYGIDYMDELPYDYQCFLQGVEVIADEDIERWSSTARRPYYQLRGEKVTEEQALDILWKTSGLVPEEERVTTMNFTNSWFMDNYFPKNRFWAHPDGTVGENGILSKYPNSVELVDDWCRYLMQFPYLDLVIAISLWDELPPYGWDEMFKGNIDFFPIYRDFPENIEAGVWVHEGKIELLSSRRTKKLYREYDKKHRVPDVKMYSEHYYTRMRPEVEAQLKQKMLDIYG